MNIVQVLQQFAVDDKLGVALFLIALDFAFGVASAAKLHTFSPSYLADFMRTDLLGKVVPWFGVYAADKVSHGAGLPVIPGLDLGDIAGASYTALVAAMVFSIVKSLGELGLALPPALQRGEKPGPALEPPITRPARV